MLADPQSITYATVAKSLPAVGRGETSSIYKLFDGTTATYTLTVSHQFAKRNRAVVRLTRDSVVTDPLVPANSIAASMSATLTLDFPTAGLVATDAQALGNALCGWLTSANILKVVNGET